jgi:putative tricarboxylic transport membrane protein
MKSALIAGTALALLTFCGSYTYAQSWSPERNVELIVPAGPGGSLDTTGRLVQRIWTELKLVPQTSSVVNRGGGGHALAYASLAQRAGDPHVLSITSPTILTNYINGRLPYTYGNFTPLAVLLTEYIAFAVPADSPLKNGRDLMDALRTSPENYSIALSSALGGTHHLSLGIPAKSAGVDMKRVKLVAFNSSGEAISAILGRHVNVIATSTAVLQPHLQSGKLRAIAVSAPKRMAGAFANTPTWPELGLKGIWENWRGVIAPGEITKQQIAYWESVLRSVTDSDEFKSYAAKNLWDSSFTGAEQMTAFLAGQYNELHEVMAFLGFAKPTIAASAPKPEGQSMAR